MSFAAALIVLCAALVPVSAAAEDFDAFIARFEQKAVDAGISRNLYRSLTKGLTPDPRVPGLVTSQPEFTRPIWDYLDSLVSERRVRDGGAAVAANKALIAGIGERYGVDPYVLSAIWGVETDFGAILNNTRLIKPIVRSLVTLAAQHRDRWQGDEDELIAAMRLIQDHGWTNQTLVGSWAGAIGHTQLIVSGLIRYGTDGDGDGRVDPQNSLADAMASTAVYLKGLGYQTGEDWGYEVVVPDGFDLLLATRETLRPVRFFADRGIRRVAGRVFADPNQPVFLYLPAGIKGPAFLMTRNYLVLKAHNFADSYALAVAHLTDRIKGAGPFVADWPRKTKFPDLEQRRFIQQALKKLRLYDGDVDGRIGPITQRAYARFQAQIGVPADGFVTALSAERLARAIE